MRGASDFGDRGSVSTLPTGASEIRGSVDKNFRIFSTSLRVFPVPVLVSQETSQRFVDIGLRWALNDGVALSDHGKESKGREDVLFGH